MDFDDLFFALIHLKRHFDTKDEFTFDTDSLAALYPLIRRCISGYLSVLDDEEEGLGEVAAFTAIVSPAGAVELSEEVSPLTTLLDLVREGKIPLPCNADWEKFQASGALTKDATMLPW